MAAFEKLTDAVAYVSAMPAESAEPAAYAGLDPVKLAECHEHGLITLERFKQAVAHAETAKVKIAAIASSDWKEVSESALDAASLTAYKALRDANVAAAMARDEFENAFAASLGGTIVEVGAKGDNGKTQWSPSVVGGKVPAGKAVQLGFRFGKISRRIVAATATRPRGSKSSAKAATTLDDLFN